MGGEAGSAPLAPHLAQGAAFILWHHTSGRGIWAPGTWDLGPHNAHRVRAVTLIHTVF